MWIYTRPRNEHELRFLINLDHCTRVNLTQLGERWFVEVMLGTEAIPVASTTSEEDAHTVLERVFTSLREGACALDLLAPPAGSDQAPGIRGVDGSGKASQRQEPPAAPEEETPKAA